uniref:peptidoglycan-binding domain-containing protein n=1 Tax=Clostridium scindens (strain JCM 10418 / VPI 12708) TaxID=29347 RepID=UPI003AB84D64
PTLGRKSRGKITALMQERLNALGYDCGAVDGINGPKTQAAIKAFQRAMGLIVDGIVGPKTWSKLLGLP